MDWRIPISSALLGLAFSVADVASAQTRFSLELLGGTAFSVPTSLTLEQNGEQDLEFSGHYETRPFDQPYYWAVRLAVHRPGAAFELQLLHHKMYLTNPPAEVQNFEITHGFNMLTVNYVLVSPPVDVRFGGGIVLPHVTGTVRDREYTSDGYPVTGPALLVGAGKRWPLLSHFWLSTEAQGTLGWARAPVSGGDVRATNLALHVLVGLGFVTGGNE